MPRIKEIEVYKLSELEGKAKERALNKLLEISFDIGNWWDYVYEDAKEAGIEITSFDLDRNRHAKGNWINSAPETAEYILANHGKETETYKTAKDYKEKLDNIGDRPENDDSLDYGEVNFQWETKREELDDEFLKSILEDYSIMLQKESEYMSSEEYLTEMAEANESEFTKEGKLV